MSTTHDYYAKIYKKKTGESWHYNPSKFYCYQIQELEKEMKVVEENTKLAIEDMERVKQKLLYLHGRAKPLPEGFE